MPVKLELGDLVHHFPATEDPALRTAPGVPAGFLSRLWCVGGLHVQIAVACLRNWILALGADAGEQEQLRTRRNLEIATEVVRRMGYLRGALTKLGQVLASSPLLLPRECIELFEELHFQVPPRDEAQVRAVLLEELGGEPEELFAEFEPRAFAAASIGQVHRARLPTGEPVAVKIQYPGVASAIHLDLRALELLLLPLELGVNGANLRACLRDVRATIEAETDYLREARLLGRAREALAPMSEVVVPRAIPGYSTRRVLTMEYLEGRHLPAFLATGPTQAERDRYGTSIYELLCTLLYREGLVYADPHPGNLLFMEDGRLGLLDLGCVREAAAAEHTLLRELVEAIMDTDRDYLEPMRIVTALPPEQVLEPEQEERLRRLAGFCWDVLRVDEARTYGEELLGGLADLLRERVDLRLLRTEPVFTGFGRWAGTLGGILARLGCRMNFRRAALRSMESPLPEG